MYLKEDTKERLIVEEDLYSLELLRYIHQNPLKAGIIAKLLDWKWSSFNVYLNDSGDDLIVEKEFLLEQFGNKVNRLKNFLDFHDEINSDFKIDCESGNFLACKEFIKEFIALHNLKPDDFSNEIVDLNFLKKITNDDALIIDQVNRLNLPSKLKEQAKIYMLHEFSKLSLTELAKRFGKPVKTLSKIKQRFRERMQRGNYTWLRELISKMSNVEIRP